MSKISLEGNASGSGTLTIAAPNTNSNYTLTLPSETGTIVTTGTTTGISASAISTGTLAAARLPAGSVLQSVTASFTTLSTSSTSSGTSAPEWGSVTITPTTSGNYLYVTFSGVCDFQTACTGESRAYITYAATGVSEAIAQQIKSGNQTSNLRTTDAFGMTTRITTANTNQYTIRVRGNGQDIFGVGKATDWIFGQIVVLEIAA